MDLCIAPRTGFLREPVGSMEVRAGWLSPKRLEPRHSCEGVPSIGLGSVWGHLFSIEPVDSLGIGAPCLLPRRVGEDCPPAHELARMLGTTRCPNVQAGTAWVNSINPRRWTAPLADRSLKVVFDRRRLPSVPGPTGIDPDRLCKHPLSSRTGGGGHPNLQGHCLVWCIA